MTNAQATNQDSAQALGRLRVLGPQEPWQCALLLPARYDDLTCPATTFGEAGEELRLFVLKVAGPAASRHDGRGPRITVTLEDATGRRAKAVLYGPTKESLPRFREGTQVALVGQRRRLGEGWILAAREIIDPAEVGRVRAVYPGRPQVIGAARVRETIREHLATALPVAAAFLAEELRALAPESDILAALGCSGWTLAQVLEQAHRPRTLAYAEHACRALDRMAALVALVRAERCRPKVGQHRPWRLPTLRARVKALPFRLTGEQIEALRRLSEGLRAPRPLRALLAGDVGTGKSAVFCALAAALADAGGRAAILLPNEVLVEQVARVLHRMYPDCAVQTVTGETPRAAPLQAPILVGTTALVHRAAGPFDLVVIDEQQKFGVTDRQGLLSLGTHVLECSATCIPRTLALARYGVIDVMELRQGHAAKTIITRIRERHEGSALFKEVAATLARGDQVLVVYPLADEAGKAARHSVEAAGTRWERMFPGRVRTLVGANDGATKRAVMDDLREGRAQVLVATTVVEVGVDLPRLRQVVVVHPERFGLSVLHQIRGRVARQGGEGQCDLYAPEALPEGSRERLSILERTQDGFEVAERDLALRGFGDLRPDGTAQSGGDESVLFGRPVTPAAVDAITSVWARFNS